MVHYVTILTDDIVVCHHLTILKKVASVSKPVSNEGERDQVPPYSYINTDSRKVVDTMEEVAAPVEPILRVRN